MGNSYHVDCFRCSACRQPLRQQQFTVDVQSRPHCISDYIRSTCAPTHHSIQHCTNYTVMSTRPYNSQGQDQGHNSQGQGKGLTSLQLYALPTDAVRISVWEAPTQWWFRGSGLCDTVKFDLFPFSHCSKTCLTEAGIFVSLPLRMMKDTADHSVQNSGVATVGKIKTCRILNMNLTVFQWVIVSHFLKTLKTCQMGPWAQAQVLHITPLTVWTPPSPSDL